jgi:hypothetical protein
MHDFRDVTGVAVVEVAVAVVVGVAGVVGAEIASLKETLFSSLNTSNSV